MKFLFSLLKKISTALAKYRVILIVLGILLLIGLIWAAGPYVGIKSVEIRFILIIVVLIIWILSLMLQRYREDEGAKKIEQSLQKQVQDQMVNALPDKKEEIESLRIQLEKAISSLKQSKLGKGYRGSAALYALPWYMFIGPPASGKSTAILHSGLQFPAMDSSGKGIQGVGGTRNCDWWFTNEAILLDTAGRYVTADEDREEWLGFLNLLKQYRKKKPINGVLAAISIADLYQADDDEVELHAKNIRGRIDELIKQLGIVFPVYVIFTKCDLIRGFVEFFEDMGKAERDQIWGISLSRSAVSGNPAQEIFESEFQLLCQSLHSRRIARLSSVLGSQKIRDIYCFPLQLSSGKDKIKRFIEILFQPSPYQENPCLRGFYFTSGTQEGAPIDRIMGAISRASGLTGLISEAFDTNKEPKSYFIKNLFTDVIFPDSNLAGASTKAVRQGDYLRVGIFVASILASVFAIAAISFSFIGNKYLLNSVNSSTVKISQMNINDPEKFVDNIYMLDSLSSRVEQLQVYEDKGVPIRLRGGLYRGSVVYPAVRDIYLERLNKLILLPTKKAIESELNNFILRQDKTSLNKDSDYYYSLLKAYLMMSNPAYLDPDFLEKRLLQAWKESTQANYDKNVSERLYASISRQIRFYAHQKPDKGFPVISGDTVIIEGARRILRRIPFNERIYSRIKQDVSSKIEPYTLEKALHGAKQEVLINDYQIPGIFTYDGYRTLLQDTVKKAIEGSGQEGWVLGVPESKSEDIEAFIIKLYFDEYISQWERFIEATRLRTAGLLPDMVKQLEVLTMKESPLLILLTDITNNTDLDKKGSGGDAGGMAQGFFQKIKKGLKIEGGGGNAGRPLNPVSVRFHSLHEFVSTSGEQKGEPPVSLYMKELVNVQDALKSAVESEGSGGGKDPAQGGTAGAVLQASRNTEKLLLAFDSDARKSIGPLLLQPFKVVSTTVTARVQTDINSRWKAVVYEPCMQSISARYPFKKDGDDALPSDVSEFFHPDNGILWKFYNQELKPFIEEGNDRWELKKSAGNGVSISAEFLENMRQARNISEGLFPRGTMDPQIAFELYPYPSPGVSEILFRLDGKDFRYRNEPQEWRELLWNSNAGSPVAVIQVNAGGINLSKSYPGKWGFFKLLNAGRVTPVSQSHYQVEWDFGGQGSRTYKVRYDLRAHSYKNPFKQGFFNKFKCMIRIG